MTPPSVSCYGNRAARRSPAVEITTLGVVIGTRCGLGFLAAIYFCNGRNSE